MLLFATPLECNACVYYLPARRAETYRSIRAPVVHIGAGDSSPCQLLSLDSGPAREMTRILGMTVELCGFTGTRWTFRFDAVIGARDFSQPWK